MNVPKVPAPPQPSHPHDDNDPTLDPSPPPTVDEHRDIAGAEAGDKDAPDPPPGPTRQDR